MRKKIRVYIICLYMPKKVMDGNLRNQEQSYLWWGSGRCAWGKLGQGQKKDIPLYSFYTFWFLNYVNVLPVQKIK